MTAYPTAYQQVEALRRWVSL